MQKVWCIRPMRCMRIRIRINARAERAKRGYFKIISELKYSCNEVSAGECISILCLMLHIVKCTSTCSANFTFSRLNGKPWGIMKEIRLTAFYFGFRQKNIIRMTSKKLMKIESVSLTVWEVVDSCWFENIDYLCGVHCYFVFTPCHCHTKIYVYSSIAIYHRKLRT